MGALFTIFQIFEYISSSFSVRDSAYATTFFVTTGFHGAHVIVGTIFLFIILIRIKFILPIHALGIDFRIWYWHFVDVIWLFLFSLFYWWAL